MRPKVFIGSSTKGLAVAEAIQRELSHDAEAILWSQSVFTSTNVPIEDLMSALHEFDFAVFVLLPEDRLTIRASTLTTVRDNVIFELGLFLGRLGRQRNFFVAPKMEGGVNMHLPSDLSGISPATYNPDAANLQAAIAIALYDVKGAIRRLGSKQKQEETIFDGRKNVKPYFFKHRNAYIVKGRTKISGKSEGHLEFVDGVLQLERQNQDGRYEIELRRNGPDIPSIPKKHDSYRIIRMKCEVKVNRGEHQLRFVCKDIKANKWVDSQTVRISDTEWKAVELYFRIAPTIDVLFRVDHEYPTEAPSVIWLKDLVLMEES